MHEACVVSAVSKSADPPALLNDLRSCQRVVNAKSGSGSAEMRKAAATPALGVTGAALTSASRAQPAVDTFTDSTSAMGGTSAPPAVATLTVPFVGGSATYTVAL